jgi:hypothetical protein
MGNDLRRLEIVVGEREKLREARREAGQPQDDEAVDRAWIDLHRDPVEVNADANHHLGHIRHLLPWVTEHLLGRWWLLTAFERKRLGTSDHPVVVVPNDRDVEHGIGTGIETADTIILPLTRRLGLALARRDTLASELAVLDDMKQEGSAATALWGNSVTSRHARRFLFHHPDDEPFRGLDLPQPRKREIASSSDPWAWMRPEDRQVLTDAGISPPTASQAPVSEVESTKVVCRPARCWAWRRRVGAVTA